MRYDVDGTNFFETYLAFKKAVERARASRGPSIIVSNVVRLLPHSNADDHRKYRTEKEIENDKKRDPLIIFSKKCIQKGIINKEEFEKLDAKALDQVNSEANWADQQSDPDPDDVMKNMYIDDDPINNYTSLEPNPFYVSTKLYVLLASCTHCARIPASPKQHISYESHGLTTSTYAFFCESIFSYISRLNSLESW